MPEEKKKKKGDHFSDHIKFQDFSSGDSNINWVPG